MHFRHFFFSPAPFPADLVHTATDMTLNDVFANKGFFGNS